MIKKRNTAHTRSAKRKGQATQSNSLLEKALSLKSPRSPKYLMPDTIDLAIAWAKEEVTITQVHFAFGGANGGSVGSYITLARALRQAVRTGRLIEQGSAVSATQTRAAEQKQEEV